MLEFQYHRNLLRLFYQNLESGRVVILLMSLPFFVQREDFRNAKFVVANVGFDEICQNHSL